MADVHFLKTDISILGWSCRLPGANSVPAFWAMLQAGQCAVTSIPADRWSLDRFGHPLRQQRGRSYTWAAGVLENAWGFDPAPFGISPREAEQMDPQQRILLELTWEALEDAGISPSSLAGQDVGVFVGGSSTDFANFRIADPSGADSHFATGNALSILANRISYAFDFKGPSLTIDTACSSSLVALHHAVQALRHRSIDTAIVGGINVLASPFSFIGFSQAGMLSPTGRCRAFSADADGYVRAEGGVVLVLRRQPSASREHADRGSHGVIVASDVNSDGRTNGIALPSSEAQQALLERVYAASGIDLAKLAFVEAHGTGTQAGDPVEAGAIGRALGVKRAKPLPIGSVKTNIGHLEPAAGLAGVLKALLALKHRTLPSSLHFTAANPAIPFADLNLSVAAAPLSLAEDRQAIFAGVNSFGFGGTNAHVIVAAPAASSSSSAAIGKPAARPAPIMLSAESDAALKTLAGRYGAALAGATPDALDVVARAAAHRRQRMSSRLVVHAAHSDDAATALNDYARGVSQHAIVAGTAAGTDLPVAFVFSGNGSQWPGMGIAAYRANAEFRKSFDAVDARFRTLAGWSLKDQMFSEDLATALRRTSVAQPLIFAIQVATTAALSRRGLKPVVVIGHSVGEVAAAAAAGILDLPTAVKVIYFRSLHQELVEGAGDMAAVLANEETVAELIGDIQGLEIAAYNSPRGVTVCATIAALETLSKRALVRNVPVIKLDLNYPFHSSLMDPVESPLLADLSDISPRAVPTAFVSTVTGAVLAGPNLGGQYWWRNVREPVMFKQGLQQAAKHGARLFIEIGPRGTLLKHIRDSLEGQDGTFSSLAALDRKAETAGAPDPMEQALAAALVAGAKVDMSLAFGLDPVGPVVLPTYAWQHRQYRYMHTTEGVGYEIGTWHPLSGERLGPDSLEWHGQLDSAALPELADHEVAGQVILPGSAFIEIAMSVARQWLKVANVVISDFEIQKPLMVSNKESRELLTRISPGSATVEIFSRPRLAAAGWLLHARGKIFHGTEDIAQARVPATGPATGQTSGAELYTLARQSGLNYGPAFRLVRQVTRHADKEIRVGLDAGKVARAFILDPMRIDAIFHGLFVLFAELQTKSRGVAYIPVRFDEMSLRGVTGDIAGARIEIRSAGPRSIFADFTVLNTSGDVVATLRGARFAAVAARRWPSVDHIAVVERLSLMQPGPGQHQSPRVHPADVLSYAKAASKDLANNPLVAADLESGMILEGWATAAAYEIVAGLADDGWLDADDCIRQGRLSGDLKPWLTGLLNGLAAAGLAARKDGRWQLVEDSLLPRSLAVLASIAAEHPARAAELLIASEITIFASQIAEGKARCPYRIPIPSVSVRDFHDLVSHDANVATELLWRVLADADLLSPRTAALRVLQIGSGAITAAIGASPVAADIALTVLEPHKYRLERARLANARGGAHFIEQLQGAEAQSFDLVIAAAGFDGSVSTSLLSEIRKAMAPTALFVAVEPPATLFGDLVFGQLPEWSDRGQSFRSGANWVPVLQAAGFVNAQVQSLETSGINLRVISAQSPDRQAVDPQSLPTVAAAPLSCLIAALPGAKPELVAALAGRPGAKPVGTFEAGRKSPAQFVKALREFKSRASDTATGSPVQRLEMVLVLPAPDASKARSGADQVALICLGIKSVVAALDDARARIWIVHANAHASAPAASGRVDPVATAAWAFCRTLANETPALDVRRVDIPSHVRAEFAAERLAQIIADGTGETELQIDRAATRVVRIGSARKRTSATGRSAPAARLERSSIPGQRIVWQAVDRPAPKAGEIEIEVEATGLNFRDLMWSMDLLPDDMLEDGFTGPALGLECAGRVSRVGPGVTLAGAGDRIVTLAPSAFSTHVIVPEQMIAKIPEAISTEAAATLPVAFLTSYYALVTQARLERDEWVLIHGGAGAVGMAAIQIAQECGARIIATAGSPAKRDLLRVLGVQHVLDSRSTAFVDDVRAITGQGVDVVLNSLAGEPMERSMQCLRPFGRFVELGKRDYVANTHLGLRPFRKNLSYFGVDVDQLIEGRKDLGQRVFANVMRLVRDGVLTPLPHSVFAAGQVTEAFQLMQQSGHIGKIVVRPPDLATIAQRDAAFMIDPKRTHFVTGAFGGFGLETVRWLVRRGARNLVLTGRRGPASDAAKAAMAELAAQGVKVVAAACDVADAKALERLLAQIKSTMPPLAGVIHAAMVLEDGLIGNLDADKLARVLAPKVTGADNLDRLTRGHALDYFILFSSVTTLFGNPGQASYVAANGYMEGLARRRRQEGLPALALGWGPIADVGVVAASEKLKGNLMARRGLTGMLAADALDLMGEALERTQRDDALAVMTIAGQDWAGSADRMPVLASPTFLELAGGGANRTESLGASIDLRALVASDAPDVVRRKVMDLIAVLIAGVLHSRVDDLNVAQPLGEIGLDSLMALELASGLEQTFEMPVALSGAVGLLSITALAEQIIAQVGRDEASDTTSMAAALAEKHISQVDAGDVEALRQLAASGKGERKRQPT